MSKQIKPDYARIYLLPPSLNEWVPKDHPARFIKIFVESHIDFKKLRFKIEENTQGRPHYSSDILLKAWLYGYTHKIYSCRELERQGYDNLSLRWLLGDIHPDHNTLWRFLKNNSEAIKKIFSQTVRYAIKLKLVKMILSAVDGTKLKSASSLSGLKSKKAIDKLISELEQDLEKNMAIAEEKRKTEKDTDYWLPEELSDEEKLKQKLKQIQKQLEAEDAEKLNPDEPEARLMRSSGKIDLCYNGQLSVDESNKIITGISVTNQANDIGMLIHMIEQTKNVTGMVPSITIADSGYASAPELNKAETLGYEVIVDMKGQFNISNRKTSKYDAINFVYNKDKDIMLCPEGEELIYSRTTPSLKHNYEIKRYKCMNKICPVLSECSKSKSGRQVRLNPYRETMYRYNEKLKNEDNLKTLKKRKYIVEGVFGIIKNVMKFRRFTVKGIKKAELQWSMICSAYNLKKIFNSTRLLPIG